MSTFVLVPGAGGASWLWHRLVPELEARGHASIAVDLPADDESAGLARYADAIVDAMGDGREADDAVVLVAQSMGALSAPLVVERRPVRMIVLLNAMVPWPGETGGEWWTNTGQDAAMRENAARLGLTASDLEDPSVLFGHDVPPEIFAEGPKFMREQSPRPFADPWPMPAWPPIPTRVIAAADDRLFPLEFQRGVARERLGIEPDVIPGGHSVALSRPAELADRLVGYLG